MTLATAKPPRVRRGQSDMADAAAAAAARAGARPSLIVALHRRYEECVAHIGVLGMDKEITSIAATHLFHELDLLRDAILVQVPDDDLDLTLVALHATLLVDLCGEDIDEHHTERLSRSLDNIVDYLVSERSNSGSEIAEFMADNKDSASVVKVIRRNRRLRDGITEDL